MNSDKNDSIGRTLIDLTPLLDVVFILLIVVIVHSRINEAEQLNFKDDRIEFYENKIEDYKEQLGGNSVNMEHFNSITVYATFNEYEDRKERTISIGINNTIETRILKPSNEDTIWNECKEIILRAIEKEDILYSILSIGDGNAENDAKMLYRDELSIIQMFNEICQEHKNIYCKYNPETMDE